MNAARQKIEAEGECRACGCDVVAWLDAAHLVSRSLLPGQGFDEPDTVVPLCSAFKSGGRAAGCHEAYDAHRLDLLPHLREDEEVAALRLARRLSPSGSGIAGAYRFLGGDLSPSTQGSDLWTA